MGCFSCFKGKRGQRGLREKGSAPAYLDPQILNEPTHIATRADPTLIADRETAQRATSPAKELHSTDLPPEPHREKAKRTASPVKELHSEPILHEEYVPRTPHEKSLSPEPAYSPPFVDSGIGTPVSKRSTPVASRSTSSKLQLSTCSTVYDCPPTPTPSRSYVSLGTQADRSASPPPKAPFLFKTSQARDTPEPNPTTPLVFKVNQMRDADEQYPTTPSFSAVRPKVEPKVVSTSTSKPEPKVLNVPIQNSSSANPITPRSLTVTPKVEPDVTNTQSNSISSTPSTSTPFYTASQTPQPSTFGIPSKPFTFNTQTPQRFTSGTQSPQPSTFGLKLSPPFNFGTQPQQGTESPQPFGFGTKSTHGTQALQPMNSGTQSSKPSTSTTQLPQYTQPLQPSQLFNYGTQPPQPSAFGITPFKFNTQPTQPPQPPQTSPFITQQAPRPSPTNTTGPRPGTLCKCGSRNNFLRTNSGDNSGREYRKCPKCQSWNGFTDSRGLSGTNNALCYCDDPAPMRLVLNRAQYGTAGRTAFYSCQYKMCYAGGTYVDEYGRQKMFERDEIARMVRLGYL